MLFLFGKFMTLSQTGATVTLLGLRAVHCPSDGYSCPVAGSVWPGYVETVLPSDVYWLPTSGNRCEEPTDGSFKEGGVGSQGDEVGGSERGKRRGERTTM